MPQVKTLVRGHTPKTLGRSSGYSAMQASMASGSTCCQSKALRQVGPPRLRAAARGVSPCRPPWLQVPAAPDIGTKTQMIDRRCCLHYNTRPSAPVQAWWTSASSQKSPSVWTCSSTTSSRWVLLSQQHHHQHRAQCLLGLVPQSLRFWLISSPLHHAACASWLSHGSPTSWHITASIQDCAQLRHR